MSAQSLSLIREIPKKQKTLVPLSIHDKLADRTGLLRLYTQKEKLPPLSKKNKLE
jgi:hypothetical protein